MFNDSSLRSVCLVVLALCMIVCPVAMGQTAATGALTGTVTDSTGAVVPGVTVTATNADTGQSRTTSTGASGSYSIGLLQPGNYRVKFEVAGFKTEEVSGVSINVTETPVVNRQLEVGTQAQEVTVAGESETVQTSSAAVGTVMNSQTVSGLPLTTRNYSNLLGLSVGANASVYNATTMGKGTTDIFVNGQSNIQNNFLMDGVSIVNFSSGGVANDATTNAGVGIVNPDAIQEFKIQTSQYDAGYGREPGANVNVVTKSGTNQFHGSAFEFFRNTALNANDFFRKLTPPVITASGASVPNNTRQVLNQNQYGGTFGVPVKKDKIFFFASYQETQQKNGAGSQGYSAGVVLPPIPTGDRSNTAAFQAALGAAVCQAGHPSVKNDSTQLGGTQVACNGSNINPVAINLLQLKNPDGSYLVPSSGVSPSSSTGGYLSGQTYSIPAQYKEHQAVGNFDYTINDKNTLSGRYFYTSDPTAISFNQGYSGTAICACLPDTGMTTRFTTVTSLLKLTSIVNNNLVNEARVSYQRIDSFLAHNIPFTNTQVGIAPILPSLTTLDQITVTGFFQFGAIPNIPNKKWTGAFEVADQISWNHGIHTIRAGAEYERDQENWAFVGFLVGAEVFQSFPDFLLGLPGCTPGIGGATATTTAAATGNCLASQTAGQTNGTSSSNISQTGTIPAVVSPNGVVHAYRQPNANAFVQDDLKLNKRLTVNLGVRWEYNGYFWDKYGQNDTVWTSQVSTVNTPALLGTSNATGSLAGWVVPSNFNPNRFPAPTVSGIFQNSHQSPAQQNAPIDNFAPRVGVAWQPLASGRLVVRGGFGYFYTRLPVNVYSSSTVQSAPYAVNVFNSGATNYYSTEAQPYAPAQLGWQSSIRWVNFAAGTSSSRTTPSIFDPQFNSPLVYEWNLNTQYELAPSWVLEVGYVGSHGNHLLSTRNLNEAQLVSASNPICGTQNGTTTCIATNTTGNASLRVPYLGYQASGLPEVGNFGDSLYDSLQVALRKQLSHGVSFQANYTWAKSKNQITTSNDPNNTAQQYGLNPGYRPQRLTVNYNWDLPFGHTDGFKGKLLNGWAVSGVTTAQDGLPLTVVDTRGGAIYGFGPGTTQISRAQFAAGMGNANVATPGGLEARLGGVTGGPGYLNTNAFTTIPVIGATAGVAGTGGAGYGNSGVGVILGPGQFNWDASVVKTTTVGGLRENATLQFRAEFFNAFNHAQFNVPAQVTAGLGNIDVSKPSTFGVISSTSVNPRLVQFALKYQF